MSYGHLWTTKATSNGCGWHSMQTPVKLWVFILAHGMKRLPSNCGIPCLRSTASARLLIPISGQRMRPCYRASDIKRWVKRVAKQATLSRFNNTLRQCVSRLVRKTLSFSKSLDNHIGAIWFFIHDYNASLLV